jgi:hypothetical protein
MSARHWNIRRLFAIAALALGLTAGFSGRAFASIHYRVWFFDDVYETYQMGDITDGNAPLLSPPDWACGMWFDSPSYYRWVDGYGNTISSANFNDEVTVWVSKPGCPEDFSIVHGNDVIGHPAGASYMEITFPSDAGSSTVTYYGARWVDENGEWPFCSGCAAANELTILRLDIDAIDVNLSAFRTVSSSLLVARVQPGMSAALASLAADIGRRRATVSQKVSARRGVPLTGYETVVRPLEDAALRRLAGAKAQLDSSAALAKQKRFADAFIACTLAAQSLEAAQSALRGLQFALALK